MTVRSGEALKGVLARTGVYTLCTDEEIVALFREAGFGETWAKRVHFGSGAATARLQPRSRKR